MYMDYKKCKGPCGKKLLLSVDFFYKKRNGIFYNKCKRCIYLERKEYNIKNKNNISIYKKKYYKKNKEKMKIKRKE